MEPEEELKGLVVASNNHPTPETRRRIHEVCSCVPRTSFPPCRQGLLEIGGELPICPSLPGCRSTEAAGNSS